MHLCSTDSPADYLARWRKNMVQEDSFKASRRRKTKIVPTNFFITEEDRGFVTRACPIDNNYIMEDTESCSGSPINGGSS